MNGFLENIEQSVGKKQFNATEDGFQQFFPTLNGNICLHFQMDPSAGHSKRNRLLNPRITG
jgi:hypothetical protein